MDNKEAIQWLKVSENHMYNAVRQYLEHLPDIPKTFSVNTKTKNIGEAVIIAIEAMEKQIEKRPKGISLTYESRVANCPSCSAFIREISDIKYCHQCGQSLDWGGSKMKKTVIY